MKKLMTLFLLVTSVSLWGQKDVQTTNNLWVTGEVKQDLKINLDDIEKYPSRIIGDVIITNHMGEPRGTASNLSVVLIKELFKDLGITPCNYFR